MSPKRRVTVSVDEELVETARAAVERGDASNLSAWVNDALTEHAEKDELLRAADEYFEWYEAEYGEITQEEMDEVERQDQERAIHVRGRGSYARIFGHEYHSKKRDDA